MRMGCVGAAAVALKVPAGERVSCGDLVWSVCTCARSHWLVHVGGLNRTHLLPPLYLSTVVPVPLRLFASPNSLDVRLLKRPSQERPAPVPPPPLFPSPDSVPLPYFVCLTFPSPAPVHLPCPPPLMCACAQDLAESDLHLSIPPCSPSHGVLTLHSPPLASVLTWCVLVLRTWLRVTYTVSCCST